MKAKILPLRLIAIAGVHCLVTLHCPRDSVECTLSHSANHEVFKKLLSHFPIGSRRTKEMKFVVFGKLLEACDWAALIGTEVNLLEGFYQRKFCLCEIFTRILCTQNSERSKGFDFYELKLLVIKTVRSQSLLLCLVNCFCKEHCTLLRLIFKIILIPYWKLIQSKY